MPFELIIKTNQEYQRILSLVISMIIIAAAYLSHSQAALGFLIVFGVASLGSISYSIHRMSKTVGQGK